MKNTITIAIIVFAASGLYYTISSLNKKITKTMDIIEEISSIREELLNEINQLKLQHSQVRSILTNIPEIETKTEEYDIIQQQLI